MKRLITLMALIFAAAIALAVGQVSPEIDSLLNVVNTAPDTAKARLYCGISWRYRYLDPKKSIPQWQSWLQNKDSLHSLIP